MLLVLMLSLLFTACGKSDKKEDNTVSLTQEETVTVTPIATATPEATTEPEVSPEPVTENENLRIISFSPSITEIIYALGAGDLLVGRTDYCDYPQEVSSVESIGDFYNPNMEKILSLEPDLVIASSLWTEDMEAKFKEAGIQVLILDENSKVSDVYGMISTLGVYLQKEDEATMLIEQMQADLTSITEALNGQKLKTVYYVTGYGEYGDYTATGDTYINDMITLAGGDNIAKDATGWSYSLETLIEKDPEVILIGSFAIDDFLASKNYQGLSAVKNKQVYAVDSNLIDRQSNRIIDGIRLIASILHPEAVTID